MKFFLSISFIFFGLAVFAQSTSEEEITLETLQNQNQQAQVQKGAFIAQVGAANQAVLNVQDKHLVQVLQEGNLNILNLQLSGVQNDATILQKGNENDYNLTLSGSDNRLQIVQEGDLNKITQDLSNSDGVDVELIQLGTGHELIQLGGGFSESPIQVIQQGSAMQVTIEKVDN